ncbi:hypothetical protein HPP92_012422 [Vanilla planifolia]|uniref:Pentatricopeptide repeat-containing protein n=1 Tax=Vanilla planifolia TaxID=51239 RepID=A0A835QTQ9_VANPL|nr:hypothetical protein HPP92_012422 [Vanilla planifolia]
MSKSAVEWRRGLLLLSESKPPKSPRGFKQLHAIFLTTGLALHSQPFSRLLLLSSLPPLSASLDGGASYSCSLLLYSPRPPSTFLSNTLTSSLASAGHLHLALSLYSLLPLHPTTTSPNPHTYPSLLKACSSSPLFLRIGLSLHAHLLKLLPLPLDHFVLTSLLILHSRLDRQEACRHLFDLIPCPDLAAWNAVLSAYARHSSDDCSSAEEALSLSEAIISACGNLGALGQGIWAHAYVERRRGLTLNRFVCAALIEMYSKCGRLDLAHQVFIALPLKEKDTFCYNAMIGGLATHGQGPGALSLFEEMQAEGLPPDDVTFVVVISACAHAGRVEEGLQCFATMELEFGIKPKVEHFVCLVDLLGRAGKIEEAEEVVRMLPLNPNAILFRTLLGACRVHNNWQVGERASRQLVQLEPSHGGSFVLLSNMHADVCQWDEALKIRKIMKQKGIDKSPGLSLVEVDGVVNEFAMGDQAHPDITEIYMMLALISNTFLVMLEA